MQNIEEIFKSLSKENKALKSKHAYKIAQEGLLRAFFFFRWCNKNQFKTLDDVVEGFAKKKIPEQQLDYYGSALVMIDLYNTDETIKESIRYIDKKVSEKTGGGVLENLPPGKIERRILKNIYANFEESIQNLKNRSLNIKKTFTRVWIFIGILLVSNLMIAFSGKYQILLGKIAPSLVENNPWIAQNGSFLSAVLFFVIPAGIILMVYFHKLMEHIKKGTIYPEEIKKMEATLAVFRDKLKEKKFI